MQSIQVEVVGICQFRKQVLRLGALPPKALFSRNNPSIFTDSSKQVVAGNFNQQKQYTCGTHKQSKIICVDPRCICLESAVYVLKARTYAAQVSD